jgi:hypothetical protein
MGKEPRFSTVNPVVNAPSQRLIENVSEKGKFQIDRDFSSSESEKEARADFSSESLLTHVHFMMRAKPWFGPSAHGPK